MLHKELEDLAKQFQLDNNFSNKMLLQNKPSQVDLTFKLVNNKVLLMHL